MTDNLKRPSESSACPPRNNNVAGQRSTSVASDSSRTVPKVKELDLNEDLAMISTDFQLTARLKISLERRLRSLLLEVLLYQAIHFGVNFKMYLSMEFLLSSLIGGKLDPRDLKDPNERRVCSLTYQVLGLLRKNYLSFDELDLIPKRVCQEIISRKLVMDSRTYSSRFQHFRPERFLEVRAVPLESIMERSKGTSKRYSSYTKGYGESHPSAHRQSTKPSAELDGEDSDRVQELSLKDLITLLYLNVLDLERRSLKRET